MIEDKNNENVCFQDILESDSSITTISPEIAKIISEQSCEKTIGKSSDKEEFKFFTNAHYEMYEYTEI
jgi:hypothetical protein